MQLAALLLVGGFELLVFHPQPLLLQHELLVQTGTEKHIKTLRILRSGPSRARTPALLLQVGDELLLVVQLVSQAADLLLMSFAVGVDLFLHRFLDTGHREMNLGLFTQCLMQFDLPGCVCGGRLRDSL